MPASSRLCLVLCSTILTCGIAAKPASWALWTADINVVGDVSIVETQRGGDPGWGVDLIIGNSSVNASIWDDDGDAFFMLRQGANFCKVSAGSNGLGPGLEVEIYEQHGLNCSVIDATGGPKTYALTLSAVPAFNGSADCDSSQCPDGACLAGTTDLCGRIWRAPTRTLVHDYAASALWTAVLALPANVGAHKTYRGADAGWGVDLKINTSMIEASVWDNDGNAFFVVRRGNLSCKISVGSDGPNPGLVVETYEQNGLNCSVSSTNMRSNHFSLDLVAEVVAGDYADCDSFTQKRCNNIWHAPARTSLYNSNSAYSAIWEASIDVPAGMIIRKTARGSDQGWGVELKVHGTNVHANIWDTDGDAYFMLSHNAATCKVSVGSNGLGPGVMIEIFQQRGLACKVATSSGGPKLYAVALSAEIMTDHHADCDSTFCPDGACPAHTSHMCDNIWRASPVVLV